MLLEVEDVAFRHAGGGGVGPVSFRLGAGEALVIAGPSGSGKTTLVHLIAGLLTPQAGRVRLEGAELSRLAPAERDALRRRTTGIVFQSLRLVSALDVAGNLALARRLSGKPADAARAHALLARLGIAGRARARPRELSQGEAQRAALARALVVEPALLIADEPTSALDDAHARASIALLEAAAKEAGAALLVVTHDRRLEDRFARRLLLGPRGLPA
ncbi:ATP-binding cassette domain-containing protein [Thermaurantiacus sp.]